MQHVHLDGVRAGPREHDTGVRRGGREEVLYDVGAPDALEDRRRLAARDVNADRSGRPCLQEVVAEDRRAVAHARGAPVVVVIPQIDACPGWLSALEPVSVDGDALPIRQPYVETLA